MKRCSLIACALIGALAAVACGDDGDSPAVTADGGADDDVADDDAADDDVADDDVADDDVADDDVADDDAADDDVADDDVADDDVADDDATDDDVADDDVADDDVPPENFIGAAGGTITTEDGLVLVVPPNSIDPEGVISVESVAVPNEGELDFVSEAWELGADGTTFDPAATLTLPFSTDAAGSEPVGIFWFDEVAEEWVALDGCAMDAGNVTCPIEHFTVVAAATVPSDPGGGGAGGEGSGGSEAGGASFGGSGVGGEAAGGASIGGSSVGGSGVGGEATGGTGGASGGAGGTGMGGSSSVGGGSTNGGSGGGTSGSCYVPCWDEIDHTACQPGAVDTCQLNGTLPNITGFNFCYDNGVKMQLGGLLSEPVIMSFKKANGDACYSLEVTGATTSTYSYTWKDGGGSTVMTATVQSSNTDVVTYQCDGMQYVIDYSDPECAGEPRPAEQASCSSFDQTCSF